MSDIFDGMKALPAWGMFRLTPDGDKFLKSPCSITSDTAGGINSFTATYAQAAAAVRPGYALGFRFDEGCGYFLLDLDHCRVGDAWSQRAVAMVNRFPGAMVEVSSSGTGLHIIGRLSGPAPAHGTKSAAGELYTQKRGVALTGQGHGSADTLHDDAFAALVAEHFPPRALPSLPGATKQVRRPEWRGPEDDEELIARALRAKQSAAAAFDNKASFQDLWEGRVAEKNSEADMALAAHLAWWTGGDAERVVRLMLRSGLARLKWQEHRTYLPMTAAKACGLLTSCYIDPTQAVVTPARVQSAADLMRQQFSPVQWAVRDILPEGVSILSGDPKAGKSWLALQMCIAVSSGKALWGARLPEAQGDALYLDLEGNERRLQRRILKFPGAQLDRLHYATDWPRAHAGVEAIRQWLTDRPQARIVVIDTLSAFRDNDPGRKNAYAHDYEVGEMLKPLPREFQVAIVLVMHNRKQAGETMHKVSGTQGMTGSVDNVLVLERDTERAEGAATLAVNGRDIEDEVELSLRLDDGVWQYVGKTSEVRTTKERCAVLDALASIGNRGTVRDIHAAMDGDVKHGTLKTRLHRMVKAGEISKSGEIYWIEISKILHEPISTLLPLPPVTL